MGSGCESRSISHCSVPIEPVGSVRLNCQRGTRRSRGPRIQRERETRPHLHILLLLHSLHTPRLRPDTVYLTIYIMRFTLALLVSAAVLASFNTAAPIFDEPLGTKCSVASNKLSNEHLKSARLLRDAIVKDYNHAHLDKAFFMNAKRNAHFDRIRAVLRGLRDELDAYEREGRHAGETQEERRFVAQMRDFNAKFTVYVDKKRPQPDLNAAKDEYLAAQRKEMEEMGKLIREAQERQECEGEQEA